MTYNSISQCASDQAFIARVTGAAAQEGAYDPYTASNALRWSIASAQDVEAAYLYAVNSDNPNPGGDEGVITDGMILSAMQAHWEGTPGVDPPTE